MNYFRITAYNKTENYSVILDSYGAFDAIWQFSSYLIAKGFSIFSVGNQDKFNDGNIPTLRSEWLKQHTFALKKLAVEFNVLQSCVVNIRAEQVHHEVKTIPDNE